MSGADERRHLHTPLPSQSASASPVASPSAAAAAHKSFIQSRRVGDLVDVADAAGLWTVGRVVSFDSEAFEIAPHSANTTMKSEWIPKSSARIGQPHSHPATNKHMRQTDASVAGAVTGLANLSVSSSAQLPTSLPSGASSQGQPVSAASSSLQLPLPPAPRSPSATPVASVSPALSSSPMPSPMPSSSPMPSASPLPAAALPSAPAKPAASAPAPAPAPAAAPSMSSDELKSFRAALRVGDLVDFDSLKHGGWFVGEVSRIDKSWAGLRPDDVSIHNHQFGDVEIMARDSSRLWPPFTKSTQPQQAPPPQPQPTVPVAVRPHQQQQQQPPQNVAHPPASARGGALPPVQGRPGNLAGGAAAAGAPPGGASQQPPGYASVAAAAAPLAVGVGEGAPGAAAPVAAPTTPANGQVPADRVPPAVPNFGYQLRRGDVCDCLDTEQKWRLSEVIGSDSTHLLIHYVDWSSKWDEWISKSDARIQPPRTRTEGYTGPANKKGTAGVAAAAHVPVVKAPPPAPVPPPRPSYSCLAACSWQRVVSTGMSHKEIAALSDVFASCCHVQDSYQEVLLGSMGGGGATPLHANSHSYSSYWSPPPPAPVFKHTLASVTELLTKLETDIALLQSSLPPLCAFPLSQCAAMASNIRALILDSEETTRRQLLSQQEDEYMKALDKKFRIVTIPSDGSCLFSAVGMGQQIQKAVVSLQEAQADVSSSKAVDSKPAGAAEAAAAPALENADVPVADGDAAVKVEDVQVSVGEADRVATASDPVSSGPVEASKPKPDPLQVLTLLRQSHDPKLQQQVAAKCRAELVEFLRAHSLPASAGPSSADAAATATPSSSHSWLEKIQSEVREVLQQESAGKYSDATSKAVWEEMQKQAAVAAQPQQASSGGPADASKPAPTPLQLADTPAAVSSYIKVMSQEGIYGTGLEVEALSEMMRAPIHIYYRSEASAQQAAPGADGAEAKPDALLPERIVGDEYPGPPIALAFFMGNKHYNLLVDRSHIPDAPVKPAAPVPVAAPVASASAPAPAAGSAPAAAATARSNENADKMAECEGESDEHALAPGGVHTSPSPAVVVVGGEIPGAPSAPSAADEQREPGSGESGATGVGVAPTAAAPTAAAMSLQAPLSKEGATPGPSASVGPSAPVKPSTPVGPSLVAPVPAAAPAATPAVIAAPAATSIGAVSSPALGPATSSTPPISGEFASGAAPGLVGSSSRPPRSASSSPAMNARTTPKLKPAGRSSPIPSAVQVAHPQQSSSSQRTPPTMVRVPSTGSLNGGSGSGSGSTPSTFYATYAHSTPVSVAEASALTISLEVHGPGTRRVSLAMRRDQPISVLAKRMPSADGHFQPLRFFTSENQDWIEVDASMTPDQLGLKPHAHIGIRP